MPQLITNIFREHVNKTYKNHNKWYTDGSLANGQVGFGVIGPDYRSGASLPMQCSVFSAEAAALALATRDSTGRSVIFTDSASCLQALEEGKSTHPYIQAIEREAEGKNITYCWIPGHSNIPGNEEADHIAKVSRHRERATLFVPAQDIVRWSHGRMWNAHQAKWDTSTRKTTRIVKPNVGKWSDQAKRKDQIVLTRLRLGHTWYTKHHLFEKKPPETCESCGRNQTVHHILVGCPLFEKFRRELRFSDNLEDILKNDRKAEEKVLKFLKKIGLYDKI